jgi:type II secretory pathway component PulJ
MYPGTIVPRTKKIGFTLLIALVVAMVFIALEKIK